MTHDKGASRQKDSLFTTGIPKHSSQRGLRTLCFVTFETSLRESGIEKLSPRLTEIFGDRSEKLAWAAWNIAAVPQKRPTHNREPARWNIPKYSVVSSPGTGGKNPPLINKPEGRLLN
jgi:hypothetical protein